MREENDPGKRTRGQADDVAGNVPKKRIQKMSKKVKKDVDKIRNG